MQVNVFIAKAADDAPPTLLVLPYGPGAAIPPHLQRLEWRHFAIAMTDDKLIGAPAEAVEAGIARDGYVLVLPTE